MKACKKLTALLAALTMLTGTAGLPVSAEEVIGTLGDTMTWTMDGDTVRCTNPKKFLFNKEQLRKQL